MAQGLRPSQYITTFGPGALVETPAGPHILMGTAEVLNRIHGVPIDMEQLAIRDIRLQRGLLDGDRIFKIPDSQNWEGFTYPTRKFPHWNLCVQHQEFNVIHKASEGCPECKAGANRRESQKNKYAIRFLIACPNGHLDDVNWNYLIHTRRGEPQTQWCSCNHFHWLGSGSSLSAIRIRCPVCSAEKPLGEIYSSRLPCRGNRPEVRNAPFETDCQAEAIVVQRGSFQLRLPEVITSLTIPPLVLPIHRILQRDSILTLVRDLKEMDQLNETWFRRLIQLRVQSRKLTAQIEAELNQTLWNEIVDALNSIERASVKKSRAEYLRQEHESLIGVVDTGFPPYPHDSDRRPGEPISFQVEATQIRKEVRGPNGKLTFRVMPIERLRVVIVQVGHRRVEYVGPKSHLTPSRGAHPMNPDEYWVPGVEQFGEGIYVDLNPVDGQSNWYPQGSQSRRWDEVVPSAEGPNELVTWNALSVWWHSFSHRLINAMSLHSGYSSTAIRERIYLSTTNTGEMRGGILLYTTQPGGDGTMGGLTSLVPDFEHILELAFNGVDRCSNDPLCEHAELDIVSKLGAACYSCEMVSETSCEHYNGYLHRGLLLENRP